MLTDEELTETERRLVRLIDEPGEAGLDIRIGDDEVDEPGKRGRLAAGAGGAGRAARRAAQRGSDHCAPPNRARSR